MSQYVDIMTTHVITVVIEDHLIERLEANDNVVIHVQGRGGTVMRKTLNHMQIRRLIEVPLPPEETEVTHLPSQRLKY